MVSFNWGHYEKVWSDQKMQLFRDYRVYYNNKYVEPFVEALNNHTHFFKEHGIDMFKDSISLPGLTLLFLFHNNDTPYILFNQSDAKLHSLLQTKLVEGPSIIFHRFHTESRQRCVGALWGSMQIASI